jgi:hypothetical protein
MTKKQRLAEIRLEMWARQGFGRREPQPGETMRRVGLGQCILLLCHLIIPSA